MGDVCFGDRVLHELYDTGSGLQPTTPNIKLAVRPVEINRQVFYYNPRGLGETPKSLSEALQHARPEDMKGVTAFQIIGESSDSSRLGVRDVDVALYRAQCIPKVKRPSIREIELVGADRKESGPLYI